MDAGADDGEAGAGEDVGVVALAGLVGLAEAVVGGEGRAGGEDGAALGVDVGLLGCALRLAGGVGQGEDDGRPVEGRHVLDDLRCTPSSPRRPWRRGRP